MRSQAISCRLRDLHVRSTLSSRAPRVRSNASSRGPLVRGTIPFVVDCPLTNGTWRSHPFSRTAAWPERVDAPLVKKILHSDRMAGGRRFLCRCLKHPPKTPQESPAESNLSSGKHCSDASPETRPQAGSAAAVELACRRSRGLFGARNSCCCVSPGGQHARRKSP